MKSVLVFGYGNPGRGDDGLGPAFIEAVEEMGLPDVESLTDMQLQVEHVLDMQGRGLVLFVDADMNCTAPFGFSEIHAEKDESYSSHAVAPQALLYAYCKVLNEEPPAAFLLRIRGQQFELGDALSAQAGEDLQMALDAMQPLLDAPDTGEWRQSAQRCV